MAAPATPTRCARWSRPARTSTCPTARAALRWRWPATAATTAWRASSSSVAPADRRVLASRSGAWRARAGRQLAFIVLVACGLTVAFNVLTVEMSWRQAIQGLLDAVLISLPVGGYLLFVRDGVLRGWFVGLGFTRDFALSSLIVLAMFLVGRAAGQVITTGNPGRFLASFRERHLLLALPFFVV